MATTYEGNGASYTYAGITLPVKTITVPGWTKEETDISVLANTDVKTKFVNALRDYNKLFLEVEFDLSDIESLPQANAALVITVPGEGTITYQAEISELEDITLQNDEQPMYRIGFTITNVSGGSETAPAYAAST